MVLNTISNKAGWYLSEISGCFSSNENIAITDLKTINRYHLNPGYYIKIKNIDNSKSEDKFILLPYLETYKKSEYFIQNIVNQLYNSQYGNRINPDFLNSLHHLIYQFHNLNNLSKRIRFLDLDLDLEKESLKKNFRIGLPEYWLEDNNIDLGDLVLLRNDYPPPILF
ncbi:MAG: hypothetical protein P8Y70_11755 [Candidatus Lokiarchaeota archaeon]